MGFVVNGKKYRVRLGGRFAPYGVRSDIPRVIEVADGALGTGRFCELFSTRQHRFTEIETSYMYLTTEQRASLVKTKALSFSLDDEKRADPSFAKDQGVSHDQDYRNWAAEVRSFWFSFYNDR